MPRQRDLLVQSPRSVMTCRRRFIKMASRPSRAGRSRSTSSRSKRMLRKRQRSIGPARMSSTSGAPSFAVRCSSCNGVVRTTAGRRISQTGRSKRSNCHAGRRTLIWRAEVPSNPIEKVAPYLYEVGDPILLIAARVEAKVDALKQAEAEVVRCRRALKESRRLLLACVKHSYVDSEIETADAMCNRQKFRS